LVERVEGGQMYSVTLRRILSVYHQIEVGMYTHGGCFVLGNIPPGTTIGRYSSIGMTARVYRANHPMNLKSSHGLFYDPAQGLTKERIIPAGRLTIGNDVFVGHNAIILPSASSIGDGAVIGAGAVVHKDIPPYAVVTGNPCRIVRYRFSKEMVDELLASRWWDKSLEELLPELASFQTPLESDAIR
jgi:acetyltransferase-like isoleucine patch superfamily enzyme